MKNKLIALVVAMLMTVVVFPVAVSAAEPTVVPGGLVTTVEELITALGGDGVARSEEGAVRLITDICLAAPVEITSGSYVLIGAGVEITASFSDGVFFAVDGDTKTSLSFGTQDQQEERDDILLNGEGDIRSASLLYVGENATVSIYAGTVLKNNLASVPGGAITNDGTLVLYGGTIENCRSAGSGGAIFSRGDLLLPGGLITDCSAEYGGAVYNEGETMLIGTEIKSCTATKGGGLFNAGVLTYHSTSLSKCQATDGGGLYNSGDATLSGGQILACLANEGEGGAMYNRGSLTINGASLEDNQAARGGGIYNVSRLTISEGRGQYSTATEAGGHLYNAVDGNCLFDGGTLSQGQAPYGGGIMNLGSLTVSGGSLIRNKAEVGAGILNAGTVFLEKSAYIDPSNDLAVLIDGTGRHAVNTTADMTAKSVAVLLPCRAVDDGYQPHYEEGVLLLQSKQGSDATSRFSIDIRDGGAWLLRADGVLGRRIPLYQNPLLYVAVVVAFAVTVGILVVSIRFFDKRKITVTP